MGKKSIHRAAMSAGMFDELIVDNFAGGGGASRGIEAAIGRSVDVAINHDRDAVDLHQINHPHTAHLCEDVWSVDPVAATGGRPVGLAWFSPDCKHFSRAKGGKPVSKKIRGLAWVAVKWAKLTRPRVIVVENVREFQDWGPLAEDDRPCPQRKGLTFRRWVAQLRNLGYAVEWRELNAADFGAPTHRRRFFLVARRDGRPIHWPTPTHGPGRAKPYRTAAECIDGSLPCPSIFLNKQEGRAANAQRPLAEKTMRRIAMGLKRYVLDNPKPFIVRCDHGGDHFRGQSIEQPLATVTGSHGYGAVMPFVSQYFGGSPVSRGKSPADPLPTVTADDHNAIVAPFVAQLAHGGGKGTWDDGRSKAVSEPVGTVHAGGNNHALVAPFLAQRYGEAPGQDTRGQTIDRPIATVTPSNNAGVLVAPTLVEVQNGGREHGSRAIDRPAHTITAGPKGGGMALAAANLIKMNFGDKQWSPADEPLRTILAGANHHAVVESKIAAAPADRVDQVRAFLTTYYGSGIGSALDRPMPTVVTRDRIGVVTVAGHEYQIVDIGLRMLRAHELLRAQFGRYADGYVLPKSQSKAVRMIGNSVPPELAEAVVAANWTEAEEVAA